MALRHFLLLISISLLGIDGRTITIKNRCSSTIWPGYIEHYQNNNPNLKPKNDCENHGFKLRPGESINMTAPDDDWEGMIWGRHRCSFDSFGIGKCLTGDCAGKLQCGGLDFPLPPFTVASIILNSSGDDSYLISLGGGFNIPMSISPSFDHNNSNNLNSSLCQTSSCLSNINRMCPSERQVRFSEEIVACKSDCQALNKAEYCCVGAVDSFTNETCQASTFSSDVNKACPDAGTNGFDLQLRNFKCSRADYVISFC